MKKILIAMFVAAVATVSAAQADSGCQNCGTPAPVSYPSHGLFHGHFGTAHTFSTHPMFGHPVFSGRGNAISRQPTLPVYMAAPWYLYFPYDGHFQTVAPMAVGGQWNAPPQSPWGGNAALPQFPGYTPYVPNQVYPGYQQGAWQPAPIPANIPAPEAPKAIPPVKK